MMRRVSQPERHQGLEQERPHNLPPIPRPALWPRFQQRSFAPEIMDELELPDRALFQVLHELDRVNHYLGGHRATLWGLNELLSGVRDRRWRIVDVGCGSGDTLREIARWAQREGYDLALTGVDMHAACLDYARAQHDQSECQTPIHWHCADYRDYTQECDIVLSSLFCHHLNDAQMSGFCHWIRSRARFGYLINDLHRHPLAYHSFVLLSQLLSRSPMVKYDGPLSVRKAFTRRELQSLFQQAGLRPRIVWRWAFRYLVMGET